jgi:hypothetical protein
MIETGNRKGKKRFFPRVDFSPFDGYLLCPNLVSLIITGR